MKQNYIFILLLIILIGAGIWYFSDKEGGETELPYLINKIEYICKDDKTIEASYFEGELIPVEPGEMLTPAGQVKVVLSDGRELNYRKLFLLLGCVMLMMMNQLSFGAKEMELFF